jgi:hypothetical protein
MTLGNRNKITETWFRGGHGDIGGNATYIGHKGEVSNRDRSDVALHWMLSKANASGLPVAANVNEVLIKPANHDAPVTALNEPVSIGNAGSLSRRIHLGDFIHYSVEQTELTRGIDGRLLRRINVLTRIEDETLEQRADALNWPLPVEEVSQPQTSTAATHSSPSLAHLSLRRYPFDVLPARTWSAWIRLWLLENSGVDADRADEFWAPNIFDRALAWDIYVELQTRITVQRIDNDEGNDNAALTSVYRLFSITRKRMQSHGVHCANTGLLVTTFLNQKVRGFTAKWHKTSINEKWHKNPTTEHPEFREELEKVQLSLQTLADALSHLADAKL